MKMFKKVKKNEIRCFFFTLLRLNHCSGIFCILNKCVFMHKRVALLGFVCFLMLVALVACGGTKVLPQSSEQSLAQSPSGSKMANEMGSMIDPRDGQIYKTVKIGNQVWMAENLNYETKKRIASFRGGMSGDEVFYYETFTSSCYDDRFSNCTRYGRLYKWPEVLDACPTGWHLPSHAEWDTLFLTVGGKDSAGKVLKSVDGWFDDGNGTDSYGFSAIPMGYRGYAHFVYYYDEGTSEDYYINEGRNASFWSSTELDSSSAYGVYMFYYKSKAEIVPDYKRLGLAIRCVMDSVLGPDSSSNVLAPVGEGSLTDSVFSVIPDSIGNLLDSRDGQTYRTVSIGSQTWMAQNLNYKTANSFCYNDADSNCTKYGRLYTWAASKDACPVGWHLPISNEWRILISTVAKLNPELDGYDNLNPTLLIPYLSISSLAGNKLKSKTGWLNNDNGVDEYGFSVYPAGFRYGNGKYSAEGRYALFRRLKYGDVRVEENAVYGLSLSYNSDGVYEIEDYDNLGLSIRCVKDIPKGSFTDPRDGQTYKTVTIDGLTWMAENLNFKMDSSAIPYCGDSLVHLLKSINWDIIRDSTYYKNLDSNCVKLGLYYTWEAAMNACPVGWHLPDSTEWESLITATGGENAAVEMLKSATGWDYYGWQIDGSFASPHVYNMGGSDYYGFGVISDGTRGEEASFWSSSEYDEEYARYLKLSSHYGWQNKSVYVGSIKKNKKLAIRCVKD